MDAKQTRTTRWEKDDKIKSFMFAQSLPMYQVKIKKSIDIKNAQNRAEYSTWRYPKHLDKLAHISLYLCFISKRFRHPASFTYFLCSLLPPPSRAYLVRTSRIKNMYRYLSCFFNDANIFDFFLFSTLHNVLFCLIACIIVEWIIIYRIYTSNVTIQMYPLFSTMWENFPERNCTV